MKTKSIFPRFVFNPAFFMKILKKSSPVLLMIFAILFLSWDHFNSSKTGSKYLSTSFHQYDMNLTDEGIALISENEEHYDNQVPAAEDVLVQKIPGDNSHLLMIAFY